MSQFPLHDDTKRETQAVNLKHTIASDHVARHDKLDLEINLVGIWSKDDAVLP